VGALLSSVRALVANNHAALVFVLVVVAVAAISTSAVRRPGRERRQVALTLADQAAAALTGAAHPGFGDDHGHVRPS
jgi:hypothetical protein